MTSGVSFVLMALVLASQVAFYWLDVTRSGGAFPWLQIALVVLACAGFLNVRRRTSARDKLFTTSTLFLLSFTIVGLQVPLLDALGYRVLPQFQDYVWSGSEVGAQAVALVCMGIVAFLLGWTGARPRQVPVRESLDVPMKRHALASWILLALAVVSYGVFLAGSGSFVRGEYTPGDASPLVSYFYKIFKIALTAALVHRVWLVFRSSEGTLRLPAYLRGLGWPLLSLLSFHLLLLLWVGDRGPLIYFALLTMGPFIVRFYRGAQTWLVGALVVATALLSVIGEVRQARFSGDSYAQRVAAVVTQGRVLEGSHPFYAGSVPLAGTMELAGSFRTITHSVDFVPKHHSHMFGYFSLMNFVAIVPGLSGFLSSVLFDSEEMYEGSANFVTRVIQGSAPKYGEGTSVVAELYIDFGMAGVVFGLMLFGAFVRVMEGELSFGGRRFSFLWVASLSFFANSIYLARSSLFGELSNTFFSYMVVLLALKLASLGTRSR